MLDVLGDLDSPCTGGGGEGEGSGSSSESSAMFM